MRLPSHSSHASAQGRGTPGPTVEECCVGNGFCAAKFRHPPKKKGPDALTSRPSGRVLFASRLWGTGKATSSHAHENPRTSAPDAHSVTQSGRICGSPRFALFRMVRCSEAQTGEPRFILDNTLPRPKRSERTEHRIRCNLESSWRRHIAVAAP